ncbi:unnamed protein product [Echinostoma caproni]|uniref:Jumonji domain-containing protein 4 n=1 Tax=Echinostoma caproni TaxID=27848 RepID=A0A3P8HXG4_9TREM|nr:unnamed protein product [Echinostoma caproni]
MDLEDGYVSGKSPTMSPGTMSPRGTLLRLDPANPPTVEPGHVVVVGAASKGIINRNQRHNAGIYQSVYSPNPFDRVTDDDLKRYRENMDRKAKGLPSLEEEEAAARIEEARQAAEVARQAMEAAAREVKTESQKYRLHSTSHSAYSSHLGLEQAPDSDLIPALFNPSLGSQSAPQDSVGDCNLPAPDFQTQCSNSLHRGLLMRRHSAARFWYWPQKFTVRSTPVTMMAPLQSNGLAESVRLTEERTVLGPRFLKRHKTITDPATTSAEGDTSHLGHSCTSGAEASHDDTEKELIAHAIRIHLRKLDYFNGDCASLQHARIALHLTTYQLHGILSYLLPNQPCILDSWITAGWSARHDWFSSEPGGVHIERLLRDSPSNELCVADCSRLEFDAHPVLEMFAEEYLAYWKSFHQPESEEKRLLYLKDWHYFRRPTNRAYYMVPEFFSSDWLNEFWMIRPDSEDDFRFVYLGTMGTWTPLHADVYRSFSWSANIIGQKRWWFFPPGEEEKLHLINNNRLPADIRALDLDQLGIRYAMFDQFPGQVVFVPSGWYHEVLNLTDCVSINHNWFNATNVARIWEHLQDQLEMVEKSTEDVRDTPGWHEQCQICLRALTGINFHEFLVLLKYILISRWSYTDPIPLDSLLTPRADGHIAQETESLLSFEKQLDVAFCHRFDVDSTVLDRAKDLPLEKVFSDVNEQLGSVEFSSIDWLPRLDFCSAASVLYSFCKHPRVRDLQLIGDSIKRRLNAIKWID